jgi:hypothetical protein
MPGYHRAAASDPVSSSHHKISSYDAEKVYSVIEDWVEEQGFEFD